MIGGMVDESTCILLSVSLFGSKVQWSPVGFLQIPPSQRVAVMNVTKENFQEAVGEFEENLPKAAFVAVNVEVSGSGQEYTSGPGQTGSKMHEFGKSG